MDKANLIFTPTLFSLVNDADVRALQDLRQRRHPYEVDTFESQIAELFGLLSPADKSDQKKITKFTQEYLKDLPAEKAGTWVYFPWKNALVHVLKKEDFVKVRTGRNMPLITSEEQVALYHKTIGVVGLSVGNSVAMSLIYSGVGNYYKLADFDQLELSNLNRIRTSVADLGLPKVIITARAIAEIDPYSTVEIFSDGMSPDNMRDFFQGTQPIDYLFDECDSLILKFFLRLAARALRLPLFMASDIGYKAEVSIISFDSDVNAGNMEEVPLVGFEDVLLGFQHAEPLELSELEKVRLICELLGVENISDEMKHALMERNLNKIVSYPQLGAIAFIGGGLTALAVLAKYRYPQQFKQHSSFHFMDDLAPPLDHQLHARKQRDEHFFEMFLKESTN